MDTDLRKEAPNVVTQTGFKELVDAGCSVEVVCKEDAYRSHSQWRGLWILRAVTADGVERELVSARALTGKDFIEIRTFKTVTGLVTFLVEMGFSVVAFPMLSGQRWSYTLSETQEDRED